MKSKKHLSVTELNKEIIDTNNISKKRKLGKCILQNRSTQLCNIIIHSCVMKKAIV